MSRNTAFGPLVRVLAAAALGGGCLLGLSSLALGAEEEIEDEELSEVQVTGTRIQSPNVTSANPITSIGAEEMRQLGIVNVADAITRLVPQNLSTYMPTMVGDNQAGSGAGGMESLDRSSFFIGNTIANLRGLDPTFGSRTLTLIDGRRVPSTSNQADVVDLNIIPSNLLQRADVVTGGASATYGSGAMAGVVNLVLNNRLQGVNLDLDYGLNEAGDGSSPHVSFSAGTRIGEKAHALIGLEWQDQSSIDDCAAARRWCAESRTLFTNGGGTNLTAVRTAIPGFEEFPARFEMSNVRYGQFAPTGMITVNSVNRTSGLWFTDDGRDVERRAFGFRGGAGGANSGTGNSVMNGDGPVTTSGTSIRPSTDRKTLFVNFEYDISERMTAYVQGNYARTESLNRNAYVSSAHCVRFDAQGQNGTNAEAGEVWVNGVSTGSLFRLPNGVLYGNGAFGDGAVPAKNVNLQSPGQPNILSEAVRLWLGVPSGQSSFVTGNGWAPGPGGFGFAPFAPPPPTAPGTYQVNALGIQYFVETNGTIIVPTAGTRYPAGVGPVATAPNPAPSTSIPLGLGINTALPVSKTSAWPYWIPYELGPQDGVMTERTDLYDFGGNAVGTWVLTRLGWDTVGTANQAGAPLPYLPAAPNIAASLWANLYNPLYTSGYFWNLRHLTLLKPFEGGTATILPEIGRNSYAFLNQLSPAALTAVQQAGSGANTGTTAWGNANAAGAGAGLDALYGTAPCTGFTGVRKVWTPQVQQFTTQRQEPYRGLIGLKGRFGGDWRWDAYYQYGKTNSTSVSHGVATNLRLSFAMDAVIDDRVDELGNPVDPATYGQPICRIRRDGPPVVDFLGHGVSKPEHLAEIGASCQPLNVFGDGVTGRTAQEIATQQAALRYAFVDSVSSGSNSLQTLSVSTNGTLWDGWGAGPLTGAFGLELRQDEVNNIGTSTGDDNIYVRSDLSRSWADSFGGKTTVTEAYTELDLPLVSGAPGLNLWSLNLGGRWAQYDNKGGAGTTRESRKQDIFNWKVQTVFEPFDFIRLRVTRSQDLRTAGYRELFINQIGIPDALARNNPFRERTALSTENQVDRYGQTQVGNINLKPETSGTLTLGMVLSPGGWAQGMRLSVDYYDIKVRNGIGVPFSGQDPVAGCFEGNGNFDGRWDSEGNIQEDPIRDNFDLEYTDLDGFQPCKEIEFGVLADGSPDLQDIVSINTSRPQNLLPYQRRGIDFAWNYQFPLSSVSERLPGYLSLNVRATRALEASGVTLQSVQCSPTSACTPRGFRPGEYTGVPASACPDGELEIQRRSRDPAGTETSQDPSGTDFVVTGYNCIRKVDLIGQIRSSTFIPGVPASPKWTGNATVSYRYGDLSAALNARYVGGAAMNLDWCDNVACPNYQNDLGEYLQGSIDNNWVKPYFEFGLNGSYDLHVGSMKQFQVFGSINNLFDKTPPFTGGGVSGATAGFHDILGRSYRMGVRMRF